MGMGGSRTSPYLAYLSSIHSPNVVITELTAAHHVGTLLASFRRFVTLHRVEVGSRERVTSSGRDP